VSAAHALVVGAAACCLWAVATSIRIAANLNRRGIKTPFPFLTLYHFRNLSRYRDLTVRETGKSGRLYRLYLILINATWILALAAHALRNIRF
jgi:hypothetical protein